MAIAATYLSPTSFAVPGDLTDDFAPGVRAKADCGPDGTRLGSVTAVGYADPATTVTLALDSGSLTTGLTGVWHGNDVPDSLIRATTDHVGAAELCTSAEAVTGTDAARVVTPAASRQQFVSWAREALGEFPGLPRPTFNLFAPHLALPSSATFSRASSATRLSSAGLVESVAVDGPRFAFDPLTGLCRGLLLEGPATNATTYAEAFDNAAWTKTRTSITANAATAPDGATTADKLVEDTTASSAHSLSRSSAFVSGSTYTISRYVKAGERPAFQISFPTAYVSANALFKLTTREMTISGAGVVASGIEGHPDGFLRCWLTATATGSGSGGCIDFLHNGTTASYTGDGASGLYLWGAQLEESPYPTSYIPTTTAAVSRAADLLTAPLASLGFTPREGSLFLSGRTPAGVPLGVATQVVAQLDDGTSNNRLLVERTATKSLRCVCVSSGVTQASLVLDAVDNDTAFRVAFSWKANAFSASLNGTAIVSDTDGTVPSGLTTLRLGADAGPGNFYGGFLRHAAYFPRALTAAHLQTMTL